MVARTTACECGGVWKTAAVSLALIGGGVAAGYCLGLHMGKRRARINNSVNLSEKKVVNKVNADDIEGEKAVMCRCWKSQNFPYCDGTHSEHNKATGDNVGPLIVEKGETDS